VLPLAEIPAFLNTLFTSHERKSLVVGKANWSYVETGQGDDLWVTFHGYGQSAEVMAHFMHHFRPNVRTIHFDLPYHGDSVLSKESLKPSELADLIGHLLKVTEQKKCSILAFSLGGKLALKLVELTPGRIVEMVLIAPDGLKINPLYRFTTNTQLGKYLYGRVISNPSRVLGAAKILSNLRLLDSKIEVFIRQQLESRTNRERIYKVWRAFRLITPDLVDIRSKIHRYHIKTTLVFGKHDKIIQPSLARKLDGISEGKVHIILLDKAHNLTTTSVAEELRLLMT
jgi:pimeloyl-ACP methyl ester carboxylesterase